MSFWTNPLKATRSFIKNPVKQVVKSLTPPLKVVAQVVKAPLKVAAKIVNEIPGGRYLTGKAASRQKDHYNAALERYNSYEGSAQNQINSS